MCQWSGMGRVERVRSWAGWKKFIAVKILSRMQPVRLFRVSKSQYESECLKGERQTEGGFVCYGALLVGVGSFSDSNMVRTFYLLDFYSLQYYWELVCVYSPTGAVVVAYMAALTCLQYHRFQSVYIVCGKKAPQSSQNGNKRLVNRLILKGKIFSDGKCFLFSQFYNIWYVSKKK